MLNLLVETKNDYISHLTNIITPLIFEGIQSIYREAQKMSDATDVLKIFQTYLKRIPKWNQNLIEKETQRIFTSSHSYEWLNDLIKATLKSNLIVLMYNPTIKKQQKIDSSFYKNISSTDFIHKVYIECARELWNNPYLLYHNYPPIEIKRNQRDCMLIIKDCIKEALRKLLPVKHILSVYLGEDIEEDINNNDFERNISEADEKNLTKIIIKDLSENNKELEYKIFANNDNNVNNKIIDNVNNKINNNVNNKIIDNVNNKINNNVNNNNVSESESELESELLSELDSDSDSKTIGSKILNIIKPQKDDKLIGKTSIETDKLIINLINESSSTQSYQNNLTNETTSITSNKNKIFDLIPYDIKIPVNKIQVDKNDKTSDECSSKDNNEEIYDGSSITGSLDDATSDIDSEMNKSISKIDENDQLNNNLDIKIKKILNNDLIETDFETSLSETNDKKYQDIFSNSDKLKKINGNKTDKLFKKFMEF